MQSNGHHNPEPFMSLNANRKASAFPEIAERLSSVEQALGQVLSFIEEARPKYLTSSTAARVEPPILIRDPEPTNQDRLQLLLATQGSATVGDIARELGLTKKTAYRLARALAHVGGGVLVYEPNGNTDRLRLYRPDRIVCER